MAIASFKRKEMKYIINSCQKDILLKECLKHMSYDPFCQEGDSYIVHNIYFDTKDNDIIKNSNDKPLYKGKIRIRNYGENEDVYFLELKRKVDGVVFKRRITLNKEEKENFMANCVMPSRENYYDKIITKEITTFLSMYKRILPRVIINYRRIALFSYIDEEYIRITFDSLIDAKRDDGKTKDLLDRDLFLLEVKVGETTPLWFVKALSRLKIYPTSFSKYGTEYSNYIKEEI